ncbi:MAG: caspase family protein [Thermotogae bacterium]|nr:caspase family protein [Thermotogota bacterium]
MRQAIKLLPILAVLILMVSCIHTPLSIENETIALIQKEEGVALTLKTTVSGVEMSFIQKGLAVAPVVKEGLLTIFDPDSDRYRYSFVDPNGRIEKGTELMMIPGKKVADVVLKKVEVVGQLSKPRVDPPFSNGFSIKDQDVNVYETFVLEIYGKNVTNLGGFELWIEYDPTRLQVNSAGGSPIALTGPCSGGLMLSPVYYEGQIKITAAFTGGVTIGSTAVPILQIQFQARATDGNAYARFGSATVISNTSASPMTINLYNATIAVSDSNGPVLLGDFNEDHIVDLLDFVAFANHYNTSASASREYDVLYDIAPAEDRYGGIWAGIYDTCTPNGVINLLDFVVFGSNYGKTEPSETNENPTVPTGPSPANNATGISTTPTLSWNPSSDPDGDPISYDVYLDTNTNPTTLKTPTSLTDPQYAATGLAPSTKYYWKVVAKDNKGGASTGGPWNFTTQSPVNNAPSAPTSPTPANGSTDTDVNLTLSWSASTDPDAGDVVSYDLYWGTSSNPTTLRAGNLSSTSYAVTNLSNATKYYWKVVAKDNHGASTASAIWNFTTEAAPSEAQYRALTVGLTTYDDGGNLDAPDNDAQDMAQMLSFLSENYTTTIRTGRVTKSALNALLTEYVSGSQAQDVFLFHYSGHGWYTGGQSNLYMSDGQSMSVTELRQKLSAINGTKIVIIDACESGSFVNLIEGRELTREEKRERMALFNAQILEVFSEPSRDRGTYSSPYEYYVLTGAAIDEYSYEDEYLNNGYLTFFLMDGMGDVGSANPTGAFDYTYNADGYGSGGVVDGQVTFKELYNYARDQVQNYVSIQGDDPQTVQGTPTSSTYVVGSYSGGAANNPPTTPSNPTPSNGSTGLSLTQTLSWSSSGATRYDVYFGTAASPAKVSSNQIVALYNPETLSEGTTYYWKIVAKNDYGNTTGAIWTFSTQSSGGDGIDFTGPTYTGNTLLVSNESTNGNSTSYTGSLSASRNRLKKDKYERNADLELEAYRLNPKLPYPEADPFRLARPETAGPQPRAVGDTRQFTVYNFRTNSDEQITATLQAIGTRTHVWAQNTTDISLTRAQDLATEFDGQIYSSVTTNFYTPSDVNGDGKIAILCFDIQDDFETTGGYIGGYFWARDLYNQTGSNLMEIFYIDTYPTMHYPSTAPVDVTKAYSTLAHEFQHMVNYNRNVLVEGGADMATWLDEGLSMAAEHLIYGTLTSRINYYNTASGIRNGHSLLYWDEAGDTLCNYSLSYLFLQYVRVQMNQGNAIYKTILQDSANDYRAVENAAKTYISSGMTFGDFMTNFRLALLLKNGTGSYGFKGEAGFSAIDTKMYTGTGTNIRGGGALFKAISGEFTDPGNAGASIQYAGIS